MWSAGILFVTVLVIVARGDVPKCLVSHTDLNPDAVMTHKDVDFLAIRVNISGYRERGERLAAAAATGIELVQQNTVMKGQQLAGLLPDKSGCAFLRVDWVERAGLGHTLSCWAHYLVLAQQLGLTYHSPFYSAAHETCNLNETAHFFGIHAAYYWAHADYFRPPHSSNTTIIQVGSNNAPCNLQLLDRAVRDYKDVHGAFTCQNHHATVFVCNNAQEPFKKRESKSIIEWVDPLRSILRASLGELDVSRYLFKNYIEAKNKNSIIVVAHIRRGDILQSRRIDRDHRLMSFAAYQNILQQVIIALQTKKNGPPPGGISVFFLCEGAQDEKHISEYDQSIQPWGFSADSKRKIYQLDAVAAIGSVCNRTTNCSATVLHKADFLQSFSAMCLSDILVMGTSGFGWPPAALCNPGLTIGVDSLFMNFDGFHNIVALKPSSAPLWHEKTRIELPNLSSKVSYMDANQNRRQPKLGENNNK